ncbi:MAG TPA: alpha/beta hydrolase, partial [Microcoleaceae bacterium UBA10368]|nr:alpha/beta hydrolase [Microcoleaceae cyanobacterium UBA10368]
PIAGSKIYQELATNGRSVKFVSIPNTGHCPHDERPSEVNSLILDWMAELN